MKVLLGISGASGAVYGVRTGALLCSRRAELHVVVTATAWEILDAELGAEGAAAPGSKRRGALRRMTHAARQRWLAERMAVAEDAFRLHDQDDCFIPFASGSNPPDAVILAPCSMGLLGRIAHGTSSSVLARCADVALKERRPLVVVPREMPLSAIQLENMLTLARAGAVVAPACPGFYHRPAAVSDLVDFVVSRILGHVGIDTGLTARWGELAAPENRVAATGRRRARR